MNPGLGYYISLPIKDSVKLNMSVNMKHSVVALLAALHVNIDITFVYCKRGKPINTYKKYVITCQNSRGQSFSLVHIPIPMF